MNSSVPQSSPGTKRPQAPHEPKIQPMCQVTFSARTYDPLPLLHILDLTPIGGVESRLSAGANLPGFSGDTLGDLAAYMAEHQLVLFGKSSYRNASQGGHWSARYTMILGREVS